MTPAELRELADRVEAEALNQAKGCMAQTELRAANECADIANRLFLMARNLRERAREIEYDAAREAASKLAEDIPF